MYLRVFSMWTLKSNVEFPHDGFLARTFPAPVRMRNPPGRIASQSAGRIDADPPGRRADSTE